MRALREEAERIKIEMNDECDCAGVFYDGDVGKEVEVQLPPGLRRVAPLLLTRAEYEADFATSRLFERALEPVAKVSIYKRSVYIHIYVYIHMCIFI